MLLVIVQLCQVSHSEDLIVKYYWEEVQRGKSYTHEILISTASRLSKAGLMFVAHVVHCQVYKYEGASTSLAGMHTPCPGHSDNTSDTLRGVKAEPVC